MTDVLAWRFTLNDKGKYDVYEEHDRLGNWVYITTVENVMDVFSRK